MKKRKEKEIEGGKREGELSELFFTSGYYYTSLWLTEGDRRCRSRNTHTTSL
jgi:hypothetical protein